MFDTMYEEEGIGIAANQIGVCLNLMVLDVIKVISKPIPKCIKYR